MNRNAQISGASFSGVEGVGMQDASLQESMGPIIDRSLENLVSTDNGIIMARRALLRAIKANKDGKKIPGLTPESQRVRSCSIVLPKNVKFAEGAKHGLFSELGTDPVTV